MRLGIMQPYFFPYVGHFSLIAACDEWIVFDTSQYTPKGWMNRNRVLHPGGGATWMTVPLSNGSIHIPASAAKVGDVPRARRSVLGQLSHYRNAPYYAVVTSLVRDVFADPDPSLTALNLRGLVAVCSYLGLPFRARRCSDLGLDLPERLPPGGWAPHLCGALGARSYVNPVGGRHLFNPADFAGQGVELRFLAARPFTYATGTHPFQPQLSIVDALMWNPPERVRAAVEDYALLRPGDLDA